MKTILYFMLFGITASLFSQQKGIQTLAQLQESPAGSKIIWFLDAVDEGNISDESIQKYFSPQLLEKLGQKKLIAAFENIKSNDGSLVLYKADRKNMTEYKLIVKGTKSNEWMEMGFYFEGERPYRIAGFTIDSTEGSFMTLEPMYPKSN